MAVDEEIDISGLVGERDGAGKPTHTGTERLAATPVPQVRRFRLVGLQGPAFGLEAASQSEHMTVGSHASNDFVIDDASASRFHCEISIDPQGVWLEDLGSRNGTLLDGVQLGRGGLRDGSTFTVGRSQLRFELSKTRAPQQLSSRTQLGSLVGESLAMRACFAQLERAAGTDATVLVQGETGTGKEGAAEAIHAEGHRAGGPFVVLNCGALPETLLESELFGHERGAFTGADVARAGIFEAANGGTVFLDEIGELPLELQPKLLRVLEQRDVRRVGSIQSRSVDVRIVAATNRDLRELVNEGAFRPDLYFRLAVLVIRTPPLRARPDDIPLLARHLLAGMRGQDEATKELLSPESIARMQRAAWPGNVRELRNYLERSLILQEPAVAEEAPDDTMMVDPSVSYAEAKRRVLDVFERRYLSALLAAHGGNVSKAAREAGMDRVYVYKLLHRHGLKPRR